MLWLALILPELPLQVHIRGLAASGLLAITENRPSAQVIAATPDARAQGIQPGQGVAGALAMLPTLRLVPRTPEREAALLKELAAWSGAFASRVCLDPPDCILLEVASSLRLFGGLDALEAALLDGLQQQGLDACSAGAPTPLAARWFARHAHHDPQSVVTPAPDWHARLDALPLELLADDGAISTSSFDLLHDLGLRTLGEVRALPAAGLARRQAQAVSETLARAYGECHDLRPAFIPPERYTAQLSLPAATVNTEPLMFAARRLFAGLASWLAARHTGIDHCRLSLQHERGEDTVLDILTGMPSRDEARLNLLARERLAVLELPSAVEGMTLSTDAPRALATRSDDLFGDPATERENALLLLDRLRARLGEDCVRQLSIVPDRRPECAWRSTALGTISPRPARNADTPAGATRPLWLLTRPRRIDAPRKLYLLRGPERIEQGWWDGHDIRRDYYLAQTADEGLWWVFRELDPPHDWYLQGYFG
ncbi:MAG: DNA polymerase Y family protein [Azoarcus sp. PHD]|nr:MAG: DNA polymerase Y family protein [Azoarcus sp. PHD]